MSRRSTTEPSMLARLTAALLALSVFALGLLAVSPEAHAAIHPDADHAGHVCAITLTAQGYCDTAPPPPVAAAPALVAEILFFSPTSEVWSAPDYWHVPAQAPPRSGN